MVLIVQTKNIEIRQVILPFFLFRHIMLKKNMLDIFSLRAAETRSSPQTDAQI